MEYAVDWKREFAGAYRNAGVEDRFNARLFVSAFKAGVVALASAALASVISAALRYALADWACAAGGGRQTALEGATWNARRGWSAATRARV